MTIKFHAVVLPVYQQMLSGLLTIIGKAQLFLAENHIEEEELVHARLAPDMLDFAWQVKVATDHVVNGLRGAVDGHYVLDRNKPPETLDSLADLVRNAREIVMAYDHDVLDGLVDRQVLHEARNVTFPATAFVLSFSMPNFFFHVVTAYDILRVKGVPVGKADYLDRLPTIE